MVGLVPALGQHCALVLLVDFEVALWSRDQEEHRELGQRDGGGHGGQQAGGAQFRQLREGHQRRHGR